MSLAANVIPYGYGLQRRPAADLAGAHAMILAERAARLAAKARLAEAAKQSSTEALIAHLKLQIEKPRRTIYGSRSERSARLLDRLEQDLRSSRRPRPRMNSPRRRRPEGRRRCVRFERKRPVRQPFPDDIEREGVVLPAPT
ncbi:conserved protein of unknown function [Bradyrhizobium vignae]|uniref:Transposase n=1 Tax=Bradyrhizobium vignae TaxID=1549949 RepID=A0A2U3QA42_9BRAD|nr:conserved protein of unknown function [Bradyrhizobium vignae]